MKGVWEEGRKEYQKKKKKVQANSTHLEFVMVQGGNNSSPN
jgi:hypothetical protein